MKKKQKRGRKSLLTAPLQKQICDLLAQGHTIVTVCDAVGLGERTYFEWCERHPHFAQATTRAIGRSKIVLVEKIRASDDWRAQAFLLERRWPDEYGRTEPRVIVVQQSQAPQMPPQVVETTVEWHKEADVPQELVRYLDLLQRTDSMSTRKKMSAANSNRERNA